VEPAKDLFSAECRLARMRNALANFRQRERSKVQVRGL